MVRWVPILVLVVLVATVAMTAPVLADGVDTSTDRKASSVPSVTEWNRTYGGSREDTVDALLETETGYLLVGSTKSFGGDDLDAWVVKTSRNGTELWNRTSGGNETDEAHTVVRATDGDGYLVGGATSSFDERNRYDSGDGWLVRIGPDGVERWNRTYEAVNETRFRDTGRTQGRETVYTAVESRDGGYLVGGAVEDAKYDVASESEVLEVAWLLEVDASGVERWNRTYTSVADSRFRGIQRHHDRYLVGGTRAEYWGHNESRWVVGVNETGQVVWERRYDRTNQNISWTNALTPAGGNQAFLAGVIRSTNNGHGDLDASVARITANGTRQWHGRYDLGGDEAATTVVGRPDGGGIVAGTWTPNQSQPSHWWLFTVDATGRQTQILKLNLEGSPTATLSTTAGSVVAGTTRGDGVLLSVHPSESWPTVTPPATSTPTPRPETSQKDSPTNTAQPGFGSLVTLGALVGAYTLLAWKRD